MQAFGRKQSLSEPGTGGVDFGDGAGADNRYADYVFN
jgi:hypothetical protein